MRKAFFVLVTVGLVVALHPAASTAAVITEYPVQAAGITGGPDGAVWFTTANAIGRITPDGAITVFPVPSELAAPNAITLGSDGALWFGTPSSIGRMTTAGVFTGFVVDPNPCCGGPTQIISGPDGAIWWISTTQCGAGCFAGTVGRIATSGQQFGTPYGEAGVSFNGIAAGPDGNVWVTGSNGTPNGTTRLWRITPSGAVAGAVTRFPNPVARRITAGSDGALWYLGGNTIGRLTTAGAVTAEYPIPTEVVITGRYNSRGSFPHDITLGPDGAVWFTELEGNKIGRITSGGAITEYQIPSTNDGCINRSSQPTEITGGPDGAVWFVENCVGSAPKIGRLVPTPFDVSAGVNQQTFGWYDAVSLTAYGQTLKTSVWLTSPPTSGSADLFTGFVLPDGNTMQFFTSANTFATGSMADPRSWRPVASGYSLSSGASIAAPNFYSYSWTGCEPRGPYTFFFLVTTAGALADGALTEDETLGVSTASFVFPKEGPTACSQ